MRSQAASTASVVRKELRSYVDGATIYIVALVFLVLWEYLFFRNAFLVGEVSLTGLFDLLPWLFLLLVPALTMGSISQEKADGTIELLLTHPLTDRQLLIGKFLAPVVLSATLLAFVLPIAIAFDRHGTLDWGIVIGQYLASVLLAATLIALGTFVSSLLTSQMSALLVTAAASFLLMIAGQAIVTASLPFGLGTVLEQLSALTHYQSMARGVIDLRDLWYFAAAIAVFLGFAYLLLLRRRYGGRVSHYRRYQIGVLLFIAVAVLSNLVGSRIPGRIDLTRDNRYSLSSATKETIKGLDDVVNVTLYASKELPPQQQPILRDVTDTLRDYETLGHGNIVVRRKDTSDKKVAEQARKRGVQEVQFNVVQSEEFKVKKGFLGIAVTHAGKTRAIPFIQSTGDLEYQLTSIVDELTNDSKKKLGFLTGHGEPDSTQVMQNLTKTLERQFDVEPVTLDAATPVVPKDIDTLVVTTPADAVSEPERAALTRYLDRGGAAMFAVDGVKLDQKTLSTAEPESNYDDVLQRYGVTVNHDVAYDVRSNLTANFNGGAGQTFLLPYPFWMRLQPSKEHPATNGLQSAVLPWASTVDVNEDALRKRGMRSTTLLTTTEFGGVQQPGGSVNPQQQLPQDDLDTRTLAVAAQGSGSGTGAKRRPRLIVVGDSDFLTDQFSQQTPENAAFASQALSWLGQERSLASIRLKGTQQHRLDFKEPADASPVRWFNLALAALLPAALGAWRLLRRRRLARFTYSSRRARKEAA